MPSAVAWKKAAKRWRKAAKYERARYWRQRDALHNAGVTVSLAIRAFDGDRGDRTVILTDSTEKRAR